MKTCAKVIAETLKSEGVKYIFGVPGAEVVNFIEATRKEGIKFILTHHETAAAFMASVTGRVTGVPGVCLSTLGPGATNMVTGIANAYLDRAPVIAITGQLSTNDYSVISHQRINIRELYKPITKWGVTISAKDTARVVRKAINIAMSGCPGPVHLELPSDISIQKERILNFYKENIEFEKSIPSYDIQKKIVQVSNLIEESKFPLIIVGIRVSHDNISQLILNLSEEKSIPVMVTPKVKGVIPEDHPLFLGVIGGMAGDKVILKLLEKVDLIIGIGFDLVEVDKPWYLKKRIISITNASSTDINWFPEIEIVGDIKNILKQLLKKWNGGNEWNQECIDNFKYNLYNSFKYNMENCLPFQIIKKLRTIVSRDCMVSCDTGAHKLLFAQVWKAYCPNSFFVSNGLSTMGYGIPAALALKLHFPNRQVICVTGDGGFLMSLHEIATAVRLNLPIIVIVFSDGSLSLIRMIQERKGYLPTGVDFDKPNFVHLAESFGAKGENVFSIKDFELSLKDSLSEKIPVILNVHINPSEYNFLI